jgi:opacity protein-like surface antigen
MRHSKNLKYLALGLILVGAGAIAQATEVGRGYVSGFIGQSELDVDGFDDDDTSFRFGGGYRLNENFAVEGYYIDYGEAETTFGRFRATAEATAFQFQAVGLLPVSSTVDLYGKLGLALWDAELSVSGFEADDDGTDLVFGFGANFNIRERITLRVEYEIAELDDADIDTIMFGVNIGF